MLLQIWFPQIVIVLGTLGALFCFSMVFFSPADKKDKHPHDEHHGH